MNNLTPLRDESHDRFINKTDYGNAKNSVYDIVNDLTNRSGLDNEFENIDFDIQEEILQTWISIVEKNYD